MNEEYYKKQIEGLILIIGENPEGMISRSYIKEKLWMILHGGINFHPVIRDTLERK